SLPSVSRLSCSQRSFSPSSPASVAGLRWIGPVRHFWSRFLFAHLIRRRERTARWQFLFFAPFSESEQLGSHARPQKLMSKPVSPMFDCPVTLSSTAGASGPLSPLAHGSTGRPPPSRISAH